MTKEIFNTLFSRPLTVVKLDIEDPKIKALIKECSEKQEQVLKLKEINMQLVQNTFINI